MSRITKNDCQFDRSWKDRAKDLNDRTWDLIKHCNGGSSFIDNSKPIGQLSEATLELASHLGQAGSQIDNYASKITSLQSQLKEAREIITGLLDFPTSPSWLSHARSFLSQTEGKSDE